MQRSEIQENKATVIVVLFSKPRRLESYFSRGAFLLPDSHRLLRSAAVHPGYDFSGVRGRISQTVGDNALRRPTRHARGTIENEGLWTCTVALGTLRPWDSIRKRGCRPLGSAHRPRTPSIALRPTPGRVRTAGDPETQPASGGNRPAPRGRPPRRLRLAEGLLDAADLQEREGEVTQRLGGLPQDLEQAAGKLQALAVGDPRRLQVAERLDAADLAERDGEAAQRLGRLSQDLRRRRSSRLSR
jgi:hypothetical protein